MQCILSASSTLSDILQLLFMLVAFVVVLFAACYTTKFMAKKGFIQPKTNNIEVKEMYRISPNKVIQIVRIGTKYIAIAVGKDEITYLTELTEEQLDFTVQNNEINGFSFSEVFKQMKENKLSDKDKSDQ